MVERDSTRLIEKLKSCSAAVTRSKRVEAGTFVDAYSSEREREREREKRVREREIERE